MRPDQQEGDEAIIEEARRRFKRCEDREAIARQRFVADIKFAEGDSDNRWQWDKDAYDDRTSARKPALTVNKTRQSNLQILNDQRQNKSQIRIRPVGDGATFKSAQIFEGIGRHIEYQSRALEAYDSAAYSQIYGGWGFWRITTDYVGDGSFDQEIFIRRVRDPLSMYLDPDAQEYDKSDSRFGFAFVDRPRDQAEVEHDWLANDRPVRNGIDHNLGWNDIDTVRECEYYRKVETDDELLHLRIPEHGLGLGSPAFEGIKHKSEMPVAWDEALHGHMAQRRRPVKTTRIEWFRIVGDAIVERNVWPGRYIPIVMVVGEETVIDGQLDRKGHTRALKDPQRIYNYFTSEACAYVAGQTKSPWLTPAAAIEGHEELWNNANVETRPYLLYNHVDDAGATIAPPSRIQPPVSHSAAMEGMRYAQNEMMMASGQYQSQFGENENAKSGVAIQTRQRQGDNATYHYIDHLAQAIEFTGRQLIDLIPKIYDTPRVIKIMAEDGSQTEVNIDPEGPAYEQRIEGQKASEEQVKASQADPNLKDAIETIFNPSVGRYDVEADIGPAFATRRQEAFASMSDLMKQNPKVFELAGDLMFRSADFPMADEIADRIKASIPPAVLGQGVPPAMQQLQQQAQQREQFLQNALGKALQQVADKGQEHQDRASRHSLESYRAETDRMKAFGGIDPEAMRLIVREEMGRLLGLPAAPDAPGASLTPMVAASAHAEQAMAPQTLNLSEGISGVSE